MRFPKFNFNINPAVHISFALVFLLVGWLMLIELFVGIWPNQNALLIDYRRTVTEQVANTVSVDLQKGDYNLARKYLQNIVETSEQILSAGIQLKNGSTFITSETHQQYWKPNQKQSSFDYIRVPLDSNGKPWGELQITYKPTGTSGFIDWFKSTSNLGLILACLGTLAIFILFLRRVFELFDPSSVIPDRVRVAFDSFSEGVMMIDRSGRVVLVNKTLSAWLDDAKNNIFGKNIQQIAALKTKLGDSFKNYPWAQAMDTQQAINGWHLDIYQPNGEIIKSVVNCSPVNDAKGGVRGCLITFDNVTEMDKLNSELKHTNNELIESRRELDKYNAELLKLATRDPMTNCLNRRAFFELAEVLFEKNRANNISLCCIMTDIDHFKHFNDVYGHAIGDKVIVAVTRNLFSGLRAEDLFCRYGGEEFCILLPESTQEIAFNLADRLRKDIEKKAGSSIRTIDDLKITASFGVSILNAKTVNLADLIDQADKALYAAKNAGRNQVQIFDAAMANA